MLCMLCEKHCDIMETSKEFVKVCEKHYEIMKTSKELVKYKVMWPRAICEDQTYVAKGRLVTYEAMRPRANVMPYTCP